MKYLVTGGLGFIGTNFTQYLSDAGNEIVIVDNMSRPGSRVNYEFLKNKYPNLKIYNHNIADKFNEELSQHFATADFVFHLAAQVAVTTSILNPIDDFRTNVIGTLNILETLRISNPSAILVYSSTNKVYGEIDDDVVQEELRYRSTKYPSGFSESVQLSFHSPYGCSKGAADQYVLDYSRIYGLKTVVFRQSCIYGEYQYGTEDQGWASWFALKALEAVPFVIYGDGKQVRDMLYAKDLFDAWIIAIENIKVTNGNAYNIGGGPDNCLSLLEYIKLIQKIGLKPKYTFAGWRPGDQRIFISNNSKFMNDTGWNPITSTLDGVSQMINHLTINYEH